VPAFTRQNVVRTACSKRVHGFNTDPVCDQTLVIFGVYELLSWAATKQDQLGLVLQNLLKVCFGNAGVAVAIPSLMLTFRTDEDAVGDVHAVNHEPTIASRLNGLSGRLIWLQFHFGGFVCIYESEKPRKYGEIIGFPSLSLELKG